MFWMAAFNRQEQCWLISLSCIQDVGRVQNYLARMFNSSKDFGKAKAITTLMSDKGTEITNPIYILFSTIPSLKTSEK